MVDDEIPDETDPRRDRVGSDDIRRLHRLAAERRALPVDSSRWRRLLRAERELIERIRERAVEES